MDIFLTTMMRHLIRQAEQVAAFEDRIKDVISIGAGNRETAIRWIFQADKLDPRDYSYACYKLNVPYSYEEEFKGVVV